jgi:N utilization substance protein B
MTTRRQIRLQAVKVLYLMRICQISATEALESYVAMGHEIDEAGALVQRVEARLQDIDSKLAEASKKWRLERMGHVDVAILRMAALELLEEQTPRAVVINEAIEIAHTLGSEDSPRFVNGVLDRLLV